MADIAVLLLVALYSVYVICRIIRKKRRGGCSGCASGSCSGCTGCSSAYIDEALASIDEDEYTNQLTSILKRKQKGLKAKDKRERYVKLFRFAAGRGFAPAEITCCLKLLGNDEDLYSDDME